MLINDILQPTHLLFILVVALLVLGPKRLPEAGRALGKGIRDFRSAIGGDEDHPGGISTGAAPPPPPEAVVPPAAAPPAEATPAPEPSVAPTADATADATAEHQAEPVHPVG